MSLLAVEQDVPHDGAHADAQHHSDDKKADTLSQVVVLDFPEAQEDAERDQKACEGDTGDR